MFVKNKTISSEKSEETVSLPDCVCLKHTRQWLLYNFIIAELKYVKITFCKVNQYQRKSDCMCATSL